MTTDTDTLVALARAWASMDGKLDKFEADDWSDPTLGYSEGYLADANELLVRSGLAARIEDLEAEVERLTAERDEWRNDFRALEKAIVGDTGLSAMTVAAQARLFRPRAERAEAQLTEARAIATAALARIGGE